jgi:uncharacterized damage-inducible protein DinB
MNGLENLRRLFAYDDWANREALASLENAGSPPPRSLRFFSHIVAAEWLWLARLKRERKVIAVWPELTLGEGRTQIGGLRKAWRSYLEGLDSAGLLEPVTYLNSKGESWTNTVGDILIHVVMHSGYHRGQIAADLRASGHEPAYTDFIHAVRQGFVE